MKPLSISSLLFSSGEWNDRPHLELISIDQIVVSRQLLLVKLQSTKWDLNFKASAQGCCLRWGSLGSLCCCVGREAGRTCRGIALVPWSGYPGTWTEEGGLLKDSPLEGKGFKKCLHGRMVVGETGMWWDVGAKSQMSLWWITWIVSKSWGQWSFWLSLPCGISFEWSLRQVPEHS